VVGLAAHPNARFTARSAVPSFARNGQSRGSSYQGIGLGGPHEQGRSSGIPVIPFGLTVVYLAATMGSEATAAAEGQPPVRRDPWRCCPSVDTTWPITGTTAEHGSKRAETPSDLPRELVPARENGKFMWPGYGEKSGCSSGSSIVCTAADTDRKPFGIMPQHQDIHWEDLTSIRRHFTPHGLDRDQAKKEVKDQEDQFDLFLIGCPKIHHTGSCSRSAYLAFPQSVGDGTGGILKQRSAFSASRDVLTCHVLTRTSSEGHMSGCLGSGCASATSLQSLWPRV